MNVGQSSIPSMLLPPIDGPDKKNALPALQADVKKIEAIKVDKSTYEQAATLHTIRDIQHDPAKKQAYMKKHDMNATEFKSAIEDGQAAQDKLFERRKLIDDAARQVMLLTGGKIIAEPGKAQFHKDTKGDYKPYLEDGEVPLALTETPVLKPVESPPWALGLLPPEVRKAFGLPDTYPDTQQRYDEPVALSEFTFDDPTKGLAKKLDSLKTDQHDLMLATINHDESKSTASSESMRSLVHESKAEPGEDPIKSDEMRVSDVIDSLTLTKEEYSRALEGFKMGIEAEKNKWRYENENHGY